MKISTCSSNHKRYPLTYRFDSSYLKAGGNARDSILFLIDCSPSMFVPLQAGQEAPWVSAIKCASATMKNKIISSEDDLVGVLFYNTVSKLTIPPDPLSRLGRRRIGIWQTLRESISCRNRMSLMQRGFESWRSWPRTLAISRQPLDREQKRPSWAMSFGLVPAFSDHCISIFHMGSTDL